MSQNNIFDAEESHNNDTSLLNLDAAVIPRPNNMSAVDDTVDESSSLSNAMTSKSPVITEPRILTEFTCFGRLPPELRIKIWGLAIPEERVIEVLWHIEIGFYTDCLNRTPGILHACPESRVLALERYTSLRVTPMVVSPRSLVGSRQYPNQKLTPEVGAYIDPTKDTLYYSKVERSQFQPRGLWAWFLSNLDANIAGKLQRLAGGKSYPADIWSSSVANPSDFTLLRFPQLNSIDIVLSDECYSTNEGVHFAPRRAPLAIKSIDTTQSFSLWNWSSRLGQARVRTFAPQLASWYRMDASAISRLRRRLIEKGLDPEYVNATEIKFSEVVRGESTWDGVNTLAQKFEASFKSGKPKVGLSDGSTEQQQENLISRPNPALGIGQLFHTLTLSSSFSE